MYITQRDYEKGTLVYLADLKHVTNLILQNAVHYKDTLGAVNWTTVTCYATEHILDDEGEKYFRVLISGAAPDAYDFQYFVHTNLKKENREAHVLTEW